MLCIALSRLPLACPLPPAAWFTVGPVYRFKLTYFLLRIQCDRCQGEATHGLPLRILPTHACLLPAEFLSVSHC